MPFEVGLAVATARWRPAHQWFLLEARPYRVQQTLSDLGGTDAYIHGDRPRQLLIALTDALVSELASSLRSTSSIDSSSS
ncbi:MAG: hypothetical protein DMD95_15420 [Candidatus Rokuibacteriota bacterium]|nr:MAG: hypothetical protein DMD95_15420 [Candidatus Rokubacteria bacterium]